MSTLFEYAVVLEGTKEEDASLLIEPTFVLAKDVASVNLQAARNISEAAMEKADRVKILVRPF